MKRETYKGRTLKVVRGRGADFGYSLVNLNGVDMGKYLGDEGAALASFRGSIDHADEVGVSSGRYGAEWYAPGTYELCEHGHAMPIGGECGHHYCAELREEAAPVVEDPKPVEARETTIRVAGVERVIRTELGGCIRTVKALETAHTKAVKAAVVDARRANLPVFQAAATKAEEYARKCPGDPWARASAEGTRNIVRRAERGTLSSWGTYDVGRMRKPFPKVRYTDEVPAYLVEVGPGHYATEEAAEQLSLC
jgi:hypothetical protein